MRNFLLSLLILIVAVSCAIWGYANPDSIQRVAAYAISALTIVFALSTLVPTLLFSFLGQVEHHNEPSLVAQQISTARNDDKRTISRLRWLNFITLLTVIVGLMFIASWDDECFHLFSRILAGIFSGGSVVVFLFSLFLPSLIQQLVLRGAYFRR
jgi:hypothetical protein